MTAAVVPSQLLSICINFMQITAVDLTTCEEVTMQVHLN